MAYKRNKKASRKRKTQRGGDCGCNASASLLPKIVGGRLKRRSNKTRRYRNKTRGGSYLGLFSDSNTSNVGIPTNTVQVGCTANSCLN